MNIIASSSKIEMSQSYSHNYQKRSERIRSTKETLSSLSIQEILSPSSSKTPSTPTSDTNETPRTPIALESSFDSSDFPKNTISYTPKGNKARDELSIPLEPPYRVSDMPTVELPFVHMLPTHSHKFYAPKIQKPLISTSFSKNEDIKIESTKRFQNGSGMMSTVLPFVPDEERPIETEDIALGKLDMKSPLNFNLKHKNQNIEEELEIQLKRLENTNERKKRETLKKNSTFPKPTTIRESNSYSKPLQDKIHIAKLEQEEKEKFFREKYPEEYNWASTHVSDLDSLFSSPSKEVFQLLKERINNGDNSPLNISFKNNSQLSNKNDETLDGESIHSVDQENDEKELTSQNKESTNFEIEFNPSPIKSIQQEKIQDENQKTKSENKQNLDNHKINEISNKQKADNPNNQKKQKNPNNQKNQKPNKFFNQENKQKLDKHKSDISEKSEQNTDKQVNQKLESDQVDIPVKSEIELTDSIFSPLDNLLQSEEKNFNESSKGRPHWEYMKYFLYLHGTLKFFYEKEVSENELIQLQKQAQKKFRNLDIQKQSHLKS